MIYSTDWELFVFPSPVFCVCWVLIFCIILGKEKGEAEGHEVVCKTFIFGLVKLVLWPEWPKEFVWMLLAVAESVARSVNVAKSVEDCRFDKEVSGETVLWAFPGFNEFKVCPVTPQLLDACCWRSCSS